MKKLILGIMVLLSSLVADEYLAIVDFSGGIDKYNLTTNEITDNACCNNIDYGHAYDAIRIGGKMYMCTENQIHVVDLKSFRSELNISKMDFQGVYDIDGNETDLIIPDFTANKIYRMDLSTRESTLLIDKIENISAAWLSADSKQLYVINGLNTIVSIYSPSTGDLINPNVATLNSYVYKNGYFMNAVVNSDRSKVYLTTTKNNNTTSVITLDIPSMRVEGGMRPICSSNSFPAIGITTGDGNQYAVCSSTGIRELSSNESVSTLLSAQIKDAGPLVYYTDENIQKQSVIMTQTHKKRTSYQKNGRKR